MRIVNQCCCRSRCCRSRCWLWCCSWCCWCCLHVLLSISTQ